MPAATLCLYTLTIIILTVFATDCTVTDYGYGTKSARAYRHKKDIYLLIFVYVFVHIYVHNNAY